MRERHIPERVGDGKDARAAGSLCDHKQAEAGIVAGHAYPDLALGRYVKQAGDVVGRPRR